jgi:acetyl esterase/lipase
MRTLWIITACIALSTPRLTAQVVVTRDVDYRGEAVYDDSRDLLDIYMPEGVDHAPVVVFFHGGALLEGEKGSGAGVARRLAEHGIGLVSANYRLSPAFQHPAHVQDAAAATAWVVHNIASYGGAPDAVYVGGHSAGAYLAALLAVDAALLGAHGIDGIAGAVLVSPFLYVEETARDRIAQDSIHGSIWGDDAQGWRQASVTPHIGPDRDNILLIYADGDDAWRKEQNERFARAMRAAGNRHVSTVEVPNRDHGSLIGAILEEDDRVGMLIGDFIGRR